MPRVFRVNVNGTDYDVTVDELTDISSQLMPQYRASPASHTPAPATPAAPRPPVSTTPSSPIPAGAGDQCAQMGGVVANILVKAGQQVTAGESIVELEAMKMKVPVTATASGKVTRIAVSVGDAVERGQVLLSIG